MRIVSIGVKMNYYFTGILIILLVLFTLFASPAYPGSTQTNTSGSNTAIEGDILQSQQLHMSRVLNLHPQLPVLQIQI